MDAQRDLRAPERDHLTLGDDVRAHRHHSDPLVVVSNDRACSGACGWRDGDTGSLWVALWRVH